MLALARGAPKSSVERWALLGCARIGFFGRETRQTAEGALSDASACHHRQPLEAIMIMVVMIVIVMMVMMTGAVEKLSELHATFTRFGAPRIVRPQIRRCVRNGIEKISVT